MIIKNIKSKILIASMAVLVGLSTFSNVNIVNASELKTNSNIEIAEYMDKLSDDLGNEVTQKYNNESKSKTVYVSIEENQNQQNALLKSNNEPKITYYYNKEDYLKEFKNDQSAVMARAQQSAQKSWMKLTIYATKKDSNTQYIDGVYAWLTYPKVEVGKDIVALASGEGANMLTGNAYLENVTQYASGEDVKSQGSNDVKISGNALSYDFWLGSNSQLIKPQHGVMHAEGRRVGSGVSNTVFNFSYFHKEIVSVTGSISASANGTISVSPAYAYDSLHVQVPVTF